MQRGRTYHGRYFKNLDSAKEEDFFISDKGKKSYDVENKESNEQLFMKGEFSGAVFAALFIIYGIFTAEFLLVLLSAAFLIFLLRRLLPKTPAFQKLGNVLFGFSVSIFACVVLASLL